MSRRLSSSQILKKLFVRSQKSAGSLSLRELAKSLKTSPGYLSKIMNGHAPLPSRLLEPVIKFLKVDDFSQNQLIQALSREALRKGLGKEIKRPVAAGAQGEESVVDAFELGTTESEWLLGQWYRTALLDLVTLENYRNDVTWIAEKLKVPKAEIERSIQYLKEAELLVADESGQLQKKHLNLRFPSKLSKLSFRQHHKSQMLRAIHCMESKNTPKDFSERLILGITVACNKDQLEAIKLELHQALCEAARKLSVGSCTEVYQLNLQLFPHTTID